MADVAVVGEAARDLLGRPVPARHVVDDHHAGRGAHADGARQVRVDLITLVPAHEHRLGEERFVGHGSLLGVR